MIRLKGINHLAMVTSNMDTTIRFWRDIIGLRLVAGVGRPGGRHYFFEIDAQNLLAFFEWDTARPVPEKDHGYPVKGPIIFDHVSFGVEEEEDLYRLQAVLRQEELWVSEVIDHGFIHSIYAFDPNGIPIEFSWNIEGVDIRKEPVMVDSAPSALTLKGPEPQGGDRFSQVDLPVPHARRTYPGAGRGMRTKPNKFKKK